MSRFQVQFSSFLTVFWNDGIKAGLIWRKNACIDQLSRTMHGIASKLSLKVSLFAKASITRFLKRLVDVSPSRIHTDQ